jgi:hypothetical protein
MIFERLYGSRGLLLYTDPDSEIILSNILQRCGYVGRADGTLLKGKKVLAVFECKVIDDSNNDLPWYTARALLAQILCSMGGTRECKVGIALSNCGFEVLFRKELELEGELAFDYFHYPRDTEDGVSLFALLHGTDPETIKANFDKFFRFLYEIVKTCVIDEPDIPKIEVEAPGFESPISRPSIQPRPGCNSDARPTKRVPPSSPQIFQNDENEPREAVNNAIPLVVESTKWEESYDYQVCLGDGTMMPLTGIAFSSNYFD